MTVNTAPSGRALVLGGAGFLGSNLVRALVADGQRPRVFTRPSRSGANLRDVFDHIDLVHGDFMDDALLRVALQGVHTVFHLITTTFPNMVIESSNYDLLSNLLPTIRMLELAREAGVRRVVYASSGGTVYGEPAQLPVSEQHELAPTSAYGQSKLTIENYLSFYARTTPLEVRILRVSNPYGPGQNLYGAQGLVAVAMGCVMDSRPLRIFGAGESVRDYVYIDDVVDALMRAAAAPTAPLVLNISSASGRSVNDVIAAVEAASGRCITRTRLEERPGDVRRSVLDNRLALQSLGWATRTGFEEGVRITWDRLQTVMGRS
jgi:UDP-glucose 4-epimerase